MYKVSCRFNFANGDISSDVTKCDLPQEAIALINKMIGIFGPINERNVNRIMDMQPGDKVKFRIAKLVSVSVKCK